MTRPQDEGHRVEWDADLERLVMKCDAPVGAYCHSVPECECEVFESIRYVNSFWQHNTVSTIFDHTTVHHHKHGSLDNCIYLDWFEDLSDSGPPESFWVYDDDDVPIPPPTGPIEFVFNGEYYEWAYKKMPDSQEGVNS